MELQIKDMPKLESPFARKLNGKDEYFVTSEINPEYSWVFESKEDEVLATEKLDGTDVSIVIENGMITSIWNRTARIPFFCKGKEHIIEGVLEAFQKGYTDLQDGQWFGECIGPKLNGNPYQLEKHLWVPFNTFCREHLAYKSWHKYPKTFENIRDWFFKPIAEGGIFSLFLRRKGIEAPPEGVVFHNIKTGQMCKLRRDMFAEFKGRRHNDGVKGLREANSL